LHSAFLALLPQTSFPLRYNLHRPLSTGVPLVPSKALQHSLALRLLLFEPRVFLAVYVRFDSVFEGPLSKCSLAWPRWRHDEAVDKIVYAKKPSLRLGIGVVVASIIPLRSSTVHRHFLHVVK
jgi:hypothetical protein